MQPELYAVFTAICWALGSLMEKTGMRLGELTPVTGTALRTLVSLMLVGALARPYLGELRTAGLKPLLMVAAGGGVLSGGIGILFLYTGLKHGQISTVMTVAFCLAPVLGVLLGVLVLKEKLTPLQLTGIILCITGAAMTVYFRDTSAA